MSNTSHPLKDPPDGGWGWVVVLSAFICCTLTAGTLYAFGVLYVAFLDAFGESKSKTAWIGSIFVFVYTTTNTVGVALTRKIGHQKTVMLAGMVMFIGLITTSFATHLAIVYFTFGIITGIGCGLAHMPSIDMVSKYFKRRLSLAIGFAMAGSGAGQFALALMGQYLLHTYGWRGTLLILSAVALNLSVAGALMWPLRGSESGGSIKQMNEPTLTSDGEKEENIKSSNTTKEDSEVNEHTIYLEPVDDKPDRGKTSTTVTNSSSNKCSCCWTSCASFSWKGSLFGEPVFWVQCLIAVGQGIAIGTVLIHMVRRGHDFGISDTHSSLIPAVMGLTQVIGRPLWGAVSHIRRLRANIPYGIAMAISGVATIISTYTRSFIGQIIFTVLFGIGLGGFTVHIPVVVASFLGNENVGFGTSILFQTQGVTMLLASPLAGWIRDETEIYDGAFWMAGIAIILAAIVAFLLPAVEKLVERKRQQHKATDRQEVEIR
ncbi:monocarboxylate transporter 12-like [Glandiceps talaboti]